MVYYLPTPQLKVYKIFMTRSHNKFATLPRFAPFIKLCKDITATVRIWQWLQPIWTSSQNMATISSATLPCLCTDNSMQLVWVQYFLKILRTSSLPARQDSCKFLSFLSAFPQENIGFILPSHKHFRCNAKGTPPILLSSTAPNLYWRTIVRWGQNISSPGPATMFSWTPLSTNGQALGTSQIFCLTWIATRWRKLFRACSWYVILTCQSGTCISFCIQQVTTTIGGLQQLAPWLPYWHCSWDFCASDTGDFGRVCQLLPPMKKQPMPTDLFFSVFFTFLFFIKLHNKNTPTQTWTCL